MGYIKKRPGDKGRVVFEDSGGNKPTGSLDDLLNDIWKADRARRDRQVKKPKKEKRGER